MIIDFEKTIHFHAEVDDKQFMDESKNINEDVIINGRSKDFFFLRGVRQSLESIKGITTAFIEAQSFEWLHSFYKWLSETKHRKEIALTKPVFLDQNRHAVAAFDDDDQLILFLPVKDVEGIAARRQTDDVADAVVVQVKGAGAFLKCDGHEKALLVR